MELNGVNLQKLALMENKSNKIKRLRSLKKECMASLCYLDVNLERQQEKFDLAQVPREYQEVIFDSYELESRLAIDLINDLKAFINEYDLPIKRIEGLKNE